MKIVLCGAGALGSWIGLFLADKDREFIVVDDDVVKEHNVGTSAYGMRHIGKKKAVVLAEMLYSQSFCPAISHVKTLEGSLSVTGPGDHLMIDTFDNVESRALTVKSAIPTVHVGLSANRTGAVLWDDIYVLPESEFKRGENPVCTHALGRHIIRLTAVIAIAAIEKFIAVGTKDNCVVMEDGKVFEL